MPSPASFRLDDNWAAFYFELAIEIGLPGGDARLQAVLDAVWEEAAIEGCYGSHDLEPEEQDPVPRTVASLAEFGHLLGRVRLPSGVLVVCGCMNIRDDEGADMLCFYVPMGALHQAGLAWCVAGGEDVSASLYDWLAEIGLRVFAREPYVLGLIGGEAGGIDGSENVADGPPEKRALGYLIPRDGVVQYFARNRW